MQGYLGVSRRFALDFDPESGGTEGKFQFRRAALRFGGALAGVSRGPRHYAWTAPCRELNVDEWLALPRGGSGGAGAAAAGAASFAGAELDVARVRRVRPAARRAPKSARGAAPTTGRSSSTATRRGHVARARWISAPSRKSWRSCGVLYLATRADGSMAKVDPRHLPGLQLHADEFSHRPAPARPARRGDLVRSAGTPARLVRERDRQLQRAGQRRLVHRVRMATRRGSP